MAKKKKTKDGVANNKPVGTTAALARHLGLSRWTVSRVINGHGGVLPETVERVHRAMAELGFQPNALARSLRGGRSGAIGVCFQEIESPILARKVALLQQALRALGYRSLIELTNGDRELERQAIVHFLSMQVEGMVLIGSQLAEDDPTLAMVHGQKVPILWVDPEHKPEGDQISVNRVWSMRLVLDHLLGLGHRRIGVIGIDPQNPYGAFRLPALLTYALKCGLNPERDLLMHYHAGNRSHDYAYGHTLMRELLERCEAESVGRPTALIALNDRVAIGAMACLRSAGIAVPEQMSIIGYDNLGVTEFLDPPLTSVDHHSELLMSRAAQILVNRINAHNSAAQTTNADAAARQPENAAATASVAASANALAAKAGDTPTGQIVDTPEVQSGDVSTVQSASASTLQSGSASTVQTVDVSHPHISVASLTSGVFARGAAAEELRLALEKRLRDEAGRDEVEIVIVGDAQHIRVRPSLIIRGSTRPLS